jgi:hypothetical protein
MIYVGIDISVNSTGMCVYNDNSYKLYNYTNKKENYIWIKDTTTFIKYRHFKYNYKEIDKFSDKLIQKLKDYDNYTELLIDDLKKYQDKLIIGIEGYNYGLKTTDTIIDISELSGMFKLKLIRTFNDCNIIILPPKTVKIETCNMVYPKINKKISRNENGKAGGSFDKHDMLVSFLKSNIDNDLKKYLIINKDKILSMKNIPKPFDDLIDSLFIMEIVKQKNNFNI